MNDKDKTVDTGGSTYVDGNVEVDAGATFVGRDQVINIQGRIVRARATSCSQSSQRRGWRAWSRNVAGVHVCGGEASSGIGSSLTLAALSRGFT